MQPKDASEVESEGRAEWVHQKWSLTGGDSNGHVDWLGPNEVSDGRPPLGAAADSVVHVWVRDELLMRSRMVCWEMVTFAVMSM